MSREETYKKIEEHFREHSFTLTKIFTRFTGSRARAEDVIQEGYVRALTYWETFPEDDTVIMQWFRRIFNNCNHDQMREEMFHGMVTQGEPEPIVNCSGYPKVMLQQVKDLIFSKQAPYDKVLYLAVFEQWAPEDIERETKLSQGNIRQICFRFRKEIKEMFGWHI